MGLKFWEAVLAPIFWVMAIVLLVSAVINFVAGAVRTVASIHDHDYEEAVVSVAITVFMGAVAVLMALLIHDAVVFT